MTFFDTDENGEPRLGRNPRRPKSERRRRLGLGILFGVVIFSIALAGVPVPYVIEEPGPNFNTLGTVEVPKDANDPDAGSVVVPLISISGTESYEPTGTLSLLTVSVFGNPQSLPGIFDVMTAWFDVQKSVVPVDAIFPPDQSEEERNDENAALMVDSQQEAIAAALINMGYQVGTQVKVVEVTTDSVSKGILDAGDIITEVNGAAVSSVDELRAALKANGTATPAHLTIIRNSITMGVDITPVDKDGSPVIGILAQPVYSFPFEVTIQLNDVGGPSAGLMFALGIIDKLTPENLTGGKNVAGTGTIDAEGNVGPIGGIRQKMYSAVSADAAYFFAPADDCGEVVGHIPANLQVISVRTLDDALHALDVIRMPNSSAVANHIASGDLATCKD